jgi:class 3 adenylate cyclase
MRCSRCGSESTSGRKFCPECGSPLAHRCAKCGADNSPSAKFCEDCGAALGPPSAVSAKKSDDRQIRIAHDPAPDNLEGERKTVTALFADIKGSTEMMEDLDPEQARAVIDPALKLMMDAVHRYDGYIVQSTGDGIFALFGAPVAHEDHPQRALYAALRMQDDLKRYAVRLRAEGGVPIEARIGANTGEVVVRSIATGEGHTEYTPIGHTTNLASRMQAVAPTGSIAVSESTRRLVEGYFTLKTLGPTKVKGVSEAIDVFEVTGLGPLRTRLQRAAGRGLTKFVGREREMDAMKHAAEQAQAGHGQIVAAMAEAGVGKSRLFHEFKLRAQSGWMVLEAFSVSHGKATAYLPVLDLFQSYFRIASEDDTRTRREKVTGRLLALDRSLEDSLPYLFGLLGLAEDNDPLAGMDPQVQRRRTLEALKRILIRESLNQPLMLVFEDLHWIDEETQAFLSLLVDALANTRVLLLVNYRPEYQHQWGNKTYYTQLRLDPLGKESADEMLNALLGVTAPIADALAGLKRLVIGRTEGNPFFMEEMVQALVEEGVLARNGAVHLTRPLDALRVPATVQAILASRIDRLRAAEKEVLQTLAVIGKEFPLSLVRAVTQRSNDELDGLLDGLQVGEFIYEQPAANDVEYTFKHALTQEVAYNSLLTERRKLVHERIAQSIEALYADAIDDHVDQLAHHYHRSANAAKAIDYAALAAEQALDRYARSEAIAGLREGFTFLERIADPEERTRHEAKLQLALCNALTLGSPAAPGTEESFLRARELCEKIGDREGVFNSLYGLRLNYNFRAQLGRALELCEEMQRAAHSGAPAHQKIAHLSEAQTLYFLGQFAAASRRLEEARQIPDDLGLSRWRRHGMPVTEPRSRAALILALLGYPDRALREGQESLAYIRHLGTSFPVALAEFLHAQLCFFIREIGKVREHCVSSLRISNELGNSQLTGYATAFLGWVDAMHGNTADGIRQIEQAVKMLDLAGAKIYSLQNMLLVECHLKNRTIEEGLALASAALMHSQNTGEKYCDSELNRLQGELLVARGASPQTEAESAFRTAIDVARAQQARWLELRATSSLARLLRDMNRRGEARAMLADIYGWFTEGLDLPDLKDAKALLDELKT